jgi:HEAT repeat protein
VRAEAIAALWRVRSSKAVTPLLALLRKAKDDLHTLHSIVHALGNIGDRRAVTPLVKAVGTKDYLVPREAGLALAQIQGCEGAIRTLIGAMGHGSASVRLNAVEVIAWFGSPIYAKDVAERWSDPREVVGELRAVVSQLGVDALARVLNGTDAAMQSRAAVALGEIGTDRAVDALIRAWEGSHSAVRKAIVAGLGKTKSNRALETLVKALSDPAVEVRRAAASCLQTFGCPPVVSALIGALADPDDMVRTLAVKALGIIGSDQAVEPLRKLLKRDCRQASKADSSRRYAVAIALGRIGSPHATRALVNALGDEDYWVAWQAAEGLEKIRDTRAIPSLIKAMGRSDNTDSEVDKWSPVRKAAARALVAIDSKGAVGPLITALRDRSRYVRSAAAETLGKIGSERAVDPLLEMLKDDAWVHLVYSTMAYVWETAGAALCKIGTKRAVNGLIRAASQKADLSLHQHAVRALALGKPQDTVPALVAVLEREGDWVGRLLGEICAVHEITVSGTGVLARHRDLQLHPRLCPRQ